MNSLAQDTKTRLSKHLAQLVKRHLLWLLIGCYVLAICWPQPGLLLRQWQWSSVGTSQVPLSIPLGLLALILFSAALVTNVAEIRSVCDQWLALCLGLVAVWLGPALLVVAAGFLTPPTIAGQPTTGLLVGLVLVATMPVANSSVGWTQNTEGNLALCLALVVLSISLSPFVTPHALVVLGMSLSPREQAYCERLVNQFSGLFFIVWVVLPTAAGFVCQWIVTRERVRRVASWFSLASAGALLALNYINSALALPSVYNAPKPLLAATAMLAIGLSLVGLILGWGIARALGTTPAVRTSLMFGLSMKHTGLALILSGVVLANEPIAILMTVLATLTQHVLAAIVQWFVAGHR